MNDTSDKAILTAGLKINQTCIIKTGNEDIYFKIISAIIFNQVIAIKGVFSKVLNIRLQIGDQPENMLLDQSIEIIENMGVKEKSELGERGLYGFAITAKCENKIDRVQLYLEEDGEKYKLNVDAVEIKNVEMLAGINDEILIQILKNIEFLSPDWHKIIYSLSYDTLKNAIQKNIFNENQNAAYKIVLEYLKKYSPAGYSAKICDIKETRLTGWVKKNNSDLPQSVYLETCGVKSQTFVACIEDYDLMKNKPREVTNNFRFSYDITEINHLQESKYAGIGLYAAESNSLVSFKIFDLEKIPKIFNIKFDDPDGSRVRGWCIDTLRPSNTIKLKFYLDGIFYQEVETKLKREDLKIKKITNGKGGFNILISENELEEGEHELKCEFPDGAFSEIYKLTGKRKLSNPIWDLSILEKPVDVVIPCFNDAANLDRCIERLQAYTPKSSKIIVVDDGSSDDIDRVIDKYKEWEQLIYLRNSENMGFAASVNRGIMASERDVILLNSDTRVGPRWLQSMVLASISRPKVGTVSAMSDRAGIFSAPKPVNNNPLPESVEEVQYIRAFRRKSAGLYPLVPTGHGFCMFIKRECLNDVGLFDAETFRFYCEENDLSMRSFRKGWQHIIDDRTYVIHNRPENFNEYRLNRIKTGEKAIDERYPEYKCAVSKYFSSSKLIMARYCALKAQHYAQSKSLGKKPRIMFVVSTTAGGTFHTNNDLMSAISEAAEIFLLTCDSKKISIFYYDKNDYKPLFSRELKNQINAYSHLSREYDAIIAGCLFDLDIDLIHIRHLAWHSLRLPEIAKKLGRKTVFSFHDYYMINQTVKMIDDSGVFLGNNYIQQGSHYRENLWPECKLPLPDGEWLGFWRERSEKALSFCDAFVTTSVNAKNTISQALPALDSERFYVIPHGRNFNKFLSLGRQPDAGERIRLLIPGNINVPKGLYIILALADYDKEELLEFHICGEAQMSALADKKTPDNIIFHGAYEREKLCDLANEISPHAAGIFSIWDETFCHTLTEAWSLGLPAFVFDFPQLASRVNKTGGGWVLKLDDIPRIYNSIVETLYDGEKYNAARENVIKWQKGEGIAYNVKMMAASYMDIYKNLLNDNKQPVKIPDSPRVGVAINSGGGKNGQMLSAFARIGERAGNAVNRNITYIPMPINELLTSINLGYIQAAIIIISSLNSRVLHKFLNLAKEKNLTYILDIDSKEIAHTPDIQSGSLKELIDNAACVTACSSSFLPGWIDKSKIDEDIFSYKLSGRIWNNRNIDRAPDGLIRALGVCISEEDKEIYKSLLQSLDNVAQKFSDFRLCLITAELDSKDIARYDKWLEVIHLENIEHAYEEISVKMQNLNKNIDFILAPLEKNQFPTLRMQERAFLSKPVIASKYWKMITDIEINNINFIENNMAEWINTISSLIIKVKNNNYKNGNHETDNYPKAGGELNAIYNGIFITSEDLEKMDRKILKIIFNNLNGI